MFGSTDCLRSSLYAVISHLVAQRRHEIGLRIALGASKADALRISAGLPRLAPPETAPRSLPRPQWPHPIPPGRPRGRRQRRENGRHDEHGRGTDDGYDAWDLDVGDDAADDAREQQAADRARDD